MECFEERQAKIRAFKMLQVVKRALALDQRSKIKPTLHNPSLLRMSELRCGSGVEEDAMERVRIEEERIRKERDDFVANQEKQRKQAEDDYFANQERMRQQAEADYLAYQEQQKQQLDSYLRENRLF